MAGRPHLQAIEAKIAKAGGDDWFFDQIEDGSGLWEIAAQLEINRTSLYRWLDHKQGRRDRYEKAKQASAESHMDEASRMLQVATPSQPFEVSLLKTQVEHKVRIAERLNPAAWAPASQNPTNVTLNIGTLHLDALRQLGGPQVIEAEIVEETKALGSGTEAVSTSTEARKKGRKERAAQAQR